MSCGGSTLQHAAWHRCCCCGRCVTNCKSALWCVFTSIFSTVGHIDSRLRYCMATARYLASPGVVTHSICSQQRTLHTHTYTHLYQLTDFMTPHPSVYDTTAGGSTATHFSLTRKNRLKTNCFMNKNNLKISTNNGMTKCRYIYPEF